MLTPRSHYENFDYACNLLNSNGFLLGKNLLVGRQNNRYQIWIHPENKVTITLDEAYNNVISQSQIFCRWKPKKGIDVEFEGKVTSDSQTNETTISSPSSIKKVWDKYQYLIDKVDFLKLSSTQFLWLLTHIESENQSRIKVQTTVEID